MKGLFKNKPRTPAELVRVSRDMLIALEAVSQARVEARKEDKVISLLNDLDRSIRDMKNILYGSSETEPVAETCAQLTQEIFKDNTFRLLIQCLPKLDLEARKDTTQVVANLQRQQVQSRLIACEYLESNKDLLDILVAGYKNPDIALHYGTMLRECIRHQSIARFVLESGCVAKFFSYVELPNFDVASDAAATFRELLTRHKSTVAEYFAKNYDWFFNEYNKRLLESSKYITKRQSLKLLGDILLDRSNVSSMLKYISSKDNLIILMNLLRDDSKNIQVEAFHVFKVFVSNPSKPPEIVNILLANRPKLLKFLGDFKTEKEDEQFDSDKMAVINEIANLEPH
ncbi:hypothetical protein R1flu_023443 [Riccia fluitans]|uniref:MO25-like protein At5g47540 n=1 Tax=Riccia fluitans TaxID=41844 RepID=A0ABD1XS42_9MARC